MTSHEMMGAPTPSQEMAKNEMSGKEVNDKYAYQIAVDINVIEEYKEILKKMGKEVDIFKINDNEKLKEAAIIAIKDGAAAYFVEKKLFDKRRPGGFWGGVHANENDKMELIASFK